MKVFTSEVELLRAECKEWEKVCEQHLRHITKLKKKRTWVGLTDDEMVSLRGRVQEYTPMDSIKYGEAIQRATIQALQDKNK
jgi:hypothetical protein